MRRKVVLSILFALIMVKFVYSYNPSHYSAVSRDEPYNWISSERWIKWRKKHPNIVPKLIKMTLKDKTFSNINFNNCIIIDTVIKNCVFKNCSFTNSKLYNVKLENVNIVGSIFLNTIFRNV